LIGLLSVRGLQKTYLQGRLIRSKPAKKASVSAVSADCVARDVAPDPKASLLNAAGLIRVGETTATRRRLGQFQNMGDTKNYKLKGRTHVTVIRTLASKRSIYFNGRAGTRREAAERAVDSRI